MQLQVASTGSADQWFQTMNGGGLPAQPDAGRLMLPRNATLYIALGMGRLAHQPHSEKKKAALHSQAEH
jgi:hypothetical protein